MTQEEKQLLLKDLCARVPYGVICACEKYNGQLKFVCPDGDYCVIQNSPYAIETVKPYLRSMSSMTEEEKEELLNLLFDKEAKCFYIDEEGLIDGKTSYLMKEGLNYPAFCPINIVLYMDWLNAHHFDYRGLIKKGLALEASKDMYK